jgi:hypothetical protein
MPFLGWVRSGSADLRRTLLADVPCRLVAFSVRGSNEFDAVASEMRGPRQALSFGVFGWRLAKTYCGSGGRWFNSPQLYQLFFNDLGGIGLPSTTVFWKGWRGSRAFEQAALELADSPRRSAHRRWRRDHESRHPFPSDDHSAELAPTRRDPGI